MIPFDRNFVIRMTIKSMRKAIDFSIRKTLERNIEFQGNEEKQREIVDTLQHLHVFHRMLDDFEKHNHHVID